MNIPIKKAMILAAGKGTRMLPLTDTIPKPLVQLKGKPLIEHQIHNLIKAGITDVIINVMHHKEQIMQVVGNGDKYNINIQYSVEDSLLGTGGGIAKALPFFNGEKFIAVSADVYTDFNFSKFNPQINTISELSHIILVPNPVFKTTGDFILHHGIVSNLIGDQNTSLTYASMGVYHPDFFLNAPKVEFCLGDWLRVKASNSKITGEIYLGLWHNIGTIEQLQQLEA